VETEANASASANAEAASAASVSTAEAPTDDARAGDLDVQQLQRELETARVQADDHHKKYLLVLADFDNFRKLNEKRVVDRLATSKKSTIGKFLPVFDNLRRALSYEEDSQGLRGGLQATMRGFEALLTSENITPLAVVGAPFDPRTAEAIATRDSGDHDDDVVLEEVERGYELAGELLRPAKVIVARRVPAAS